MINSSVITTVDVEFTFVFILVILAKGSIYLASLVVFSFFEKNYLLLSYATSVRPSVVPSVCLSSVEIISFHGISISNRPIDLKIGLDVRKGVVHVRKAWFFEILIASCKFMQFAIFLQINLCARF